MTDSITGPGVPLTTAQRIAKYGARTRPRLVGGIPDIELDASLDPKYREAVLIRYEDFDRDAAKVLRDRRAWLGFLIVGAVVTAAAGALWALSVFTVTIALGWAIPAAVVVAVSFIYRRYELRRHREIVEDARAHAKSFVDSGKAIFL